MSYNTTIINTGRDIDFDEFAKNIETLATELFMEHKKLPPRLVTYKNRVIQASEIPMRKDQTHSPLLLVKPVLEKYQPQFWGVAFEAWVKIIDGKTEEETMRLAEQYKQNYTWGDMQKKESRKRECIQIVAESLDGSQHYDRMYKIKRAYGQVKLKRFKENIVMDSETLPIKGGNKEEGVPKP